MKLLANLLIAISLAVALVSASTAYLAELDRPDEALAGLTLIEKVQRVEADGVSRSDVARKGAELDARVLEALREAGVQRVRVEEFELGRWRQSWVFLLALLGLGVGAVLVRRANAAALLAVADEHGPATRVAPEAELAAIVGIVDELLGEWRPDPGPDSARVLARLSVAIDDHGPAFVGARELLIARMGLGAYAGLMDRFAAAERQIHRAWSAAADDVLEETHVCLQRARVVLEEARAALGSAGR